MKKLLLFFSKPIVGGILSLIGLLEILFNIPSSYITYYGHENEMYNVGLNLKEVEGL